METTDLYEEAGRQTWEAQQRLVVEMTELSPI